MPTARGYFVAVVSLVLMGVGRAFGTGSLEQLGFALLVLILVAVAVVRLGRHDLVVTRTLTPARAGQGRPVTVTIEIQNEGRGAAPLLLIEDRLPPGLSGNARFALHGIEPDGVRRTGFTIRAVRRGSYEVGPLEVGFVDPFGLARTRWPALGTSTFLVHPRVDRLRPLRDRGERRSLASAARRQPTGSRGEDFYTLREYVEGDDLRKIHWPATAKRDTFMIRQEETPWHTRATVVLDDRAEGHDGIGDASSFERAVEAAASLCDLHFRTGHAWRLMSAVRSGPGPSKGRDHLNRCLDLLATVQPVEGSSEALVGRLGEIEAQGSVEAALVLVAGTLDLEAAVALTRCGRRFRQVTAVLFPRHRFGAGATKSRWEGEHHTVEVARLLVRSGVRTVVLGLDEPLAAGWSASSHREGERWGQKPELV